MVRLLPLLNPTSLTCFRFCSWQHSPEDLLFISACKSLHDLLSFYPLTSFPLPSPSFLLQSTGLLAVSGRYKAHPYLRAFPLMLTFARNTTEIHYSSHISFSSVLSKFTLLSAPNLETAILFHCLHPPHPVPFTLLFSPTLHSLPSYINISCFI